jgi:hypothetical protein
MFENANKLLPVVGTVWRHKKSGGVYTVIGTCRLEATNAPAYLYTSTANGVIWARDMDEFLDGRFENITPK